MLGITLESGLSVLSAFLVQVPGGDFDIVVVHELLDRVAVQHVVRGGLLEHREAHVA